jgi:anti-sigma factor RsiW
MSSERTCRETTDLLMDYVEDVLPPDERAALDAHFAACPPCLAFVCAYRETPRIAREATAAEMPREVAERLEAFLHTRGQGGC